MVELGWSTPASRIDADKARRGILWQHEQIRALLGRSRRVAEQALDGEPPYPDAVASAVGDLRSAIEIHLTFEEKVLLPLLDAAPPTAAPRGEHLRQEHRHQRDMLAALHREASAHPFLPTLAAKLAFVTSWLLSDMEAEERSMLVVDEAESESPAIRP